MVGAYVPVGGYVPIVGGDGGQGSSAEREGTPKRFLLAWIGGFWSRLWLWCTVQKPAAPARSSGPSEVANQSADEFSSQEPVFVVIYPGGAVLRKTALLTSDKIAVLHRGETVTLVEERGRRFCVRARDGLVGWISAETAEEAPIVKRVYLPDDQSAKPDSVQPDSGDGTARRRAARQAVQMAREANRSQAGGSSSSSKGREYTTDFERKWHRKWQKLRGEADGEEGKPLQVVKSQPGRAPIDKWRPPGEYRTPSTTASSSSSGQNSGREKSASSSEVPRLEAPPGPHVTWSIDKPTPSKEPPPVEDLLDVHAAPVGGEPPAPEPANNVPTLTDIFSTWNLSEGGDISMAGASELVAPSGRVASRLQQEEEEAIPSRPEGPPSQRRSAEERPSVGIPDTFAFMDTLTEDLDDQSPGNSPANRDRALAPKVVHGLDPESDVDLEDVDLGDLSWAAELPGASGTPGDTAESTATAPAKALDFDGDAEAHVAVVKADVTASEGEGVAEPHPAIAEAAANSGDGAVEAHTKLKKLDPDVWTLLETQADAGSEADALASEPQPEVAAGAAASGHAENAAAENAAAESAPADDAAAVIQAKVDNGQGLLDWLGEPEPAEQLPHKREDAEGADPKPEGSAGDGAAALAAFEGAVVAAMTPRVDGKDHDAGLRLGSPQSEEGGAKAADRPADVRQPAPEQLLLEDWAKERRSA